MLAALIAYVRTDTANAVLALEELATSHMKHDVLQIALSAAFEHSRRWVVDPWTRL